MLYDSFKLKFKNMPLMCTEEGTEVGYHNHSEFEILLITEGNPDITISDRVYSASKGDILFINQMEMHSVTSKEPYLLKCICFDPSIICDSKVLSILKNDSMFITNHIKSKQDTLCIKELFHSIEQAYETSDEWSDSQITLYVTALFIYLFKNNFVSNKSQTPKASPFCSDVLEYISANFSLDITSREISSSLGYSQSYFCRRFKRDFGQSFSDYLTMYRVSISKILLEDESCTVARAAMDCGFNSADYFCKCFKKFVGLLPSEYKKNRKNSKL